MASCGSCKAKIRWAMTADTRRRIPLDDTPSTDPTVPHVYYAVPHGNELWAYKPADLREKVALKEAVSTDRAATLCEDRYDLLASHFTTCPNATQHSRGGNR